MSRSIFIHTLLSLRILHSLEHSHFMGGFLDDYLGISLDVHHSLLWWISHWYLLTTHTPFWQACSQNNQWVPCFAQILQLETKSLHASLQIYKALLSSFLAATLHISLFICILGKLSLTRDLASAYANKWLRISFTYISLTSSFGSPSAY